MRVRGNGAGGARPERRGPGAGGLVGRAEELGVLRRLLAQRRLVTVVGGAGVGKSLLAAHAAAAVGGSLADGVVRVRWWDGGATRRRTVAQAVAEALDAEAEGTGTAVGVDEVVARLRSRRMLVVLDDFDPVRVDCVHLVHALLEGAPGVRVLAAGRHPLGLGDEAVLRLGPLAVTAPGPEPTDHGPAVALFLDRVRAARRRVAATGRQPCAPEPTDGPAGTADNDGGAGVRRLRGAVARARRGRAAWVIANRRVRGASAGDEDAATVGGPGPAEGDADAPVSGGTGRLTGDDTMPSPVSCDVEPPCGGEAEWVVRAGGDTAAGTSADPAVRTDSDPAPGTSADPAVRTSLEPDVRPAVTEARLPAPEDAALAAGASTDPAAPADVELDVRPDPEPPVRAETRLPVPEDTAPAARASSDPAAPANAQPDVRPVTQPPVRAEARLPVSEDTAPAARTSTAPATPTDDELRIALHICRRLEGIPLAIELAAAQVAEYSMVQIVRMLDAGQGWLGVADAPLRRHRSLRAAVGAGYALCDPTERTTWARLSVFAGDFDEDAAVFVCSGGGLGAEEVPVCLARLVLASVLTPVRDPGGVLPPRYRMTEAARGFGAERLQSAGETAAAVSRHLYWYANIAASAHHLWSTGLHERATSLVREEEDNLRAALARQPRSADEAAGALTVAVDLWFWWAVCGHAAEGREHLRRLLPQGRVDSRLCGQALWLAGWLAVCVDAPDAAELLGQAWRVGMLAGDDATIGRVSHVLGAVALEEGRTERAIAHLREAADTIPVHAEHGPAVAVSWALLAVAQARVRPADARRSIRRASAEPQPRHDLWTRSMTQYAQAVVDHLRGRRSRAWRRAHKALAGAVGVAGAARTTTACGSDGTTGATGSVGAPAIATVAGPPGAALIHQLIADIEAGPAPSV
ncbi:AAA family ATPase [Streptomyces sp. NPDC087300]|uniref:ATP-binding protein n=1 Tax=Streptomyces sp. NPDC087300 TaxID=3365780 RepID=UPI0037F37D1F